MAALPLLLAGPIVRRVTPRSVAVWVALKNSAAVTLTIWDHAINAGTDPGVANVASPPLRSASNNSIRIGEKLHVAVVTITLPVGAGPLLPGQLYSYNVAFGGADLKSEGLLVDRFAAPGTPAPRLALGYRPGFLPTFALPPLTIDRVWIAHGSCRKAHGPGKDSLAALDTVIRRSIKNDEPEQRPHVLFLTGDQIYADEVPTALITAINTLGSELLGQRETVPAKKSDNTTEPFEVSMTNFPATRRERLVTRNGKFTSGAAANHLIGFGEFAATYLMYWNNEVWADELYDDNALRQRVDFLATWDSNTTTIEQALAPLDPGEQKKFDDETAAQKAERIAEKKASVRRDYKDDLKKVIAFRAQLPNVRRVLANVPVYMIFDDHEITDDWYITKHWRDTVLTSPLGLTIIRNGLMAYALFQDWGNDPDQFTQQPKAGLLTNLQAVFPAAVAAGPVQAAADAIDIQFGFNLVDETPPPIKWHYSVPCSETIVYVLDTRTRRTYETRYSPSGLLSDTALDDQLPIAPPGSQFVVVVSPAPVLGLGLMEELLQPVVTRFVAYKADPEAWGFAPATFEKFLSRLQPLKRVVLLSGDVHFSVAAYLDYWKRNEPAATRIVQFVSSGLKNQQFSTQQFLLCGFMQQLLNSAFRPGERLGYTSGTGLQATNPAGTTNPPALRMRLRREPALLPTVGWPAGTTVNRPFDWAWRMDMLFDTRPDDASTGARPDKIRPMVISPDVQPVTGDGDAAYRKVLARHLDLFLRGGSRRVMWDSNVGIVRFMRDPSGTLTAIQDLWFWVLDDEITDDPDAYTSFAASLEPTTDAAPVLPRP